MLTEGRFRTKSEAAETLGVSLRAVYRYISRGYLRTAQLAGQAGVWEADVLELKRVRDAEADKNGEMLPFAVNKTTLAMLHARVCTLEMRVAVIARILGVRHDPLALTDLEILGLSTAATTYAEEGWPPHVEEIWVDVFVRLRLEDLEQLERLTGDAHPWRAFHRLCATMCLVPYNADLRSEFVQGRTNLYGLAALWSQMRGFPPSRVDGLVARDGAPDRRLLRRLGRTRGNGTTNGAPGSDSGSPQTP